MMVGVLAVLPPSHPIPQFIEVSPNKINPDYHNRLQLTSGRWLGQGLQGSGCGLPAQPQRGHPVPRATFLQKAWPARPPPGHKPTGAPSDTGRHRPGFRRSTHHRAVSIRQPLPFEPCCLRNGAGYRMRQNRVFQAKYRPTPPSLPPAAIRARHSVPAKDPVRWHKTTGSGSNGN